MARRKSAKLLAQRASTGCFSQTSLLVAYMTLVNVRREALLSELVIADKYVLSDWHKYVLGLREDRQRTYNPCRAP